MRTFQFWLLTIGSIFVSLLYLEQVYLSRSIYQQQRLLMESQQIASYGPSYQNSWKQLAMRVYQASKQDDALADVLKRNDIAIQVSHPEPTPAPAPVAQPAQVAPTPQTSTKSSGQSKQNLNP
jgi:uncharacterized membrane protein (UPF0182 family)